MKLRGRQWLQSRDCAVTWQDTLVPTFSKERHPDSGEQKKDLDGVHPRGTFIRADAPPLPSYLGSGAVSANGCEREGRDQCDAKDVKKDHPCTSKQQTETEA